MIKKLSKYGNSLAVLIDKPILELLNINEKTPLRIKTDGRSIIIEPVRVSEIEAISSDKKMQKIYEELLEKYEPTLKKLSDS